MTDYAPRNHQGKHPILDDDPRAIALLKEEHHAFRELFDQVETLEGEARFAQVQEILLQLSVHLTIEEELFYPAVKQATGSEEPNHGIVEHATAKSVMAELEQLKGTEELYAAKVHVLGEETIHHIDEEDEDLFEDAKAAHRDGKLDLDELGDRMRTRQAELYDRIVETGDEGETDEAIASEVESVSAEELAK